MRSPVRQSTGRVAIEWALRLAALALLAVALWRLVRPANVGARAVAEVANATTARAALARWTTDSAARDVALTLDLLPSATERDWLRALAHAGRRVRWSAAAAAPAVLSAEPLAAPAGGVRVRVAARGPAVAVADAAGLIDTLPVAGGPASLAVVGARGPLLAHAGGTRAQALAPAAPRLGRVLVLGRAGWEAKFTVAALEEAGWTVDARLPVAPGVRVTQGSAAPPDTARDAAVVALDSSALSLGTQLRAYVESGGGLVLAGEAAALPAFAALAAGASGALEPGVAGAFATTAPRRALAIRPVLRPRADAVVVERRGPAIAVAARRVGRGRVLQVGYDETWRWRMEGDDDAPAAHRAWWTAAVSSVAFAPLLVDTAAALDGAPWAHVIDALGPPSALASTAATADTRASDPLPLWFLLLSIAALLAEWASRRLRGAR